MTKQKILIAGIGGVGGYIGARLARSYSDSTEVEICFLTRGENLKAIRNAGIKLKTDSEDIIAKPAIVTNDPLEIGPVNYVICCVKNYDLENVMEQLRPCIHAQTIILPLLNGIDAPTKIRNVIPDIEVWDGCIYLVSRIGSPGNIIQKGNINLLYFGSENGNKVKLQYLEDVLQTAGISAHLSINIKEKIWEKYVFISAIGSLTSYLNTGIGSILNNEDHKKLLLAILGEVMAVAKAHDIILSEDVIETILKQLATLPPETTSSMQLDLSKGNRSELNSLTAHVIQMGINSKVSTPAYQMIFDKLNTI